MNFSNKGLLNKLVVTFLTVSMVIITGATFELGNSKNPFYIPHLI